MKIIFSYARMDITRQSSSKMTGYKNILLSGANVLKFRMTSCLQKKAKTNSADPDQTASEEAV